MENELTRILTHHDPRMCKAHNMSRETELVFNRLIAIMLNGAKLSQYMQAEAMTEYMIGTTRSILDHVKLDKEETERVLVAMMDICSVRIVSERLNAMAEGKQEPDDPAALH